VRSLACCRALRELKLAHSLVTDVGIIGLERIATLEVEQQRAADLVRPATVGDTNRHTLVVDRHHAATRYGWGVETFSGHQLWTLEQVFTVVIGSDEDSEEPHEKGSETQQIS
jgi:hypothetical protein